MMEAVRDGPHRGNLLRVEEEVLQALSVEPRPLLPRVVLLGVGCRVWRRDRDGRRVALVLVHPRCAVLLHDAGVYSIAGELVVQMACDHLFRELS